MRLAPHTTEPVIPLQAGGTGASTAEGARSNLGLSTAITVQGTEAGQIMRWTGTEWATVPGQSFDATGHQTFSGDARPWRDALGELLGKKRVGTRITEDLTEGTILFADNCVITQDYVIHNLQLNHDRDNSANLYPHLHWHQASANMPNWLIEYRWQINGQAKTTGWTRAKWSGNAFTYTAGALNQITLFPTMTPPVGNGVSDIIQFRVARDTNNASTLFSGSDPLSGNAAAVSFDTHFQINSLGSTDEYTK